MILAKHIITDAHVHINTKANNPENDYRDYLANSGINKSNLIINSEEQFDIFRSFKYTEMLDGVFFTFLIDKNNFFSKNEIKRLDIENKKYGIKIHPRLSNIQSKDINWYIEICNNSNAEVIIVDDFHIGEYMSLNNELQIICEIAKNCHNKKIVVAHSGGFNLIKDVMYTKHFENIFYDIALTINYFKYSSIENDLAWFMNFQSKRIMIGSDYPDFTIDDAYSSVNKIFQSHNLSKNLLDNIFYTTYENVYG